MPARESVSATGRERSRAYTLFRLALRFEPPVALLGVGFLHTHAPPFFATGRRRYSVCCLLATQSRPDIAPPTDRVHRASIRCALPVSVALRARRTTRAAVT